MEQKKWSYKVIVVFDGQSSQPWPEGLPAPIVGDEITGYVGNANIRGSVTKRTWGMWVEPATTEPVAVMTITVESPKSAQPARATVQHLKL